MIIEVAALNEIDITVTVQAPPAVSLVKENTVNISVPLVGIAGPAGSKGDDYQQSFESVCLNLESVNLIDSTFSASTITKTYAGDITVTINFVAGKPTTKVLSGAGLPSGIATTCTYDFTGRTIPLKTYT